MQEDDLYPNDSSYFPLGEPEEQSVARKKEKAQTLQALPELKATIERLQTRIDFYENITSIPDSLRTKPKQFMIMHNSYSLTAKTLRSEKEYIEGLIDTNARNR